jgi:hypothetical protein
MDEATNKTIKEIEICTKQWKFSNLSEQLYIWFDRFNERFFNNVLKPPVISFEKTSSRTLGHYVIGRNAFGLKWNININRQYVGSDLASTLATLLHEAIHLWQEEFGKKKGKRNRNNYHNVEFRTKAKLIGIPCNNYGVTLHYQDPFVSLLRDHGVSVKCKVSTVVESEKIHIEPTFGRSKLKKWSCGCTNVRVAVADFRAKCLKCNNEFQLVEGLFGLPVEPDQS